MPIAQAERLCPQAVFLPVDMKAYLAVHRALVELFGRYTDLVEVASIDEAYLDVTGSRRLFGPPRAIAHRIQEQVYDAHGVTCSIGIGPTKLLAKLAAGLNKPAGIGELTDADVHGRLRDAARRRGLRHRPGHPGAARRPRPHHGRHAAGRALPAARGGLRHGRARRCASSPSAAASRRCAATRPLPKSVGREITFADDTNDRELLRATLLALADERRGASCAATAWRRAPWRSRCASTPSTPSSRRRTLRAPGQRRAAVYEAAAALLDELDSAPAGCASSGSP